MADMFDTSNVGIGKGREGGYAIVAPKGTDPAKFEDMTKTLAELLAEVTGAESLGYVSEDGVTISTEVDSEDKKDWGGDVIASPISSFSESVSATFQETRDAVLKAVFGDENVTTNGATTVVRHNKNFNGSHLYVFDCVVSDTKVVRTIVPYGVITERDDLTYNNSDLVGYTPTIKCIAYAGYDGDGMRQFVYDSSKAA